MPSIDSRAISARINNKLADEFTQIAEGRGYTTAGLLTKLIREVVDGSEDDTEYELTERSSRLYGVALELVDDLMEAGYPDGEIESALKCVRRDML